MLKRQLSIWTAVLALSAGSLFAMVHPNYEQGECWGVQAEYLYWLPDADSTYFVADSYNSAGTIVGNLVDNPLGFHSGFRVEGAFALDCTSDLQVRYARLRATSSKTVTGTGLWAALGGSGQLLYNYAGSASSDLDFYFQNVELLYSNRVWDSCSFSHFYVFGGLQYYHFHYKENYSYIETTGAAQITSRSNRVDGVGPEFGFEFVCPLDLCWCGWNNSNLAIVGLASTSLLAQKSQNKYSNAVGTTTYIDSKTPSIWQIIPSFNARAGLQYASTCWCLDFDLEIGYEFTTYVNGFSKIEAPAGYALVVTENHNIDMQGLYVALGLAF